MLCSWAVNLYAKNDLIPLLVTIHSPSLTQLEFTGITSKERSFALPGCLEDLSVHNVVQYGPGKRWVIELLSGNRLTLSHLTMGREQSLVSDYDNGGVLGSDGNWINNLLASLKQGHGGDPASDDPILGLKTLRAINVNANRLLHDTNTRFTSLADLTALTLESCKDLPELFTNQASLGEVDSPNCMKLRSLSIRYEKASNAFRAQLQSFLCQMHPLENLYVLLEGEADAQDLRPILVVHGKTLRCLVWDEREGRRVFIAKSRMTNSAGIGHLQVISHMCPNLEELGVAINWEPPFCTAVRHDVRLRDMQAHQTKVFDQQTLRNVHILTRMQPDLQRDRKA